MKRSALKRRKPLKRGKGIRKMSDKRRVETAEYYRLRKIYLDQNPTCQFPGCVRSATDLHHKALRGKNYLKVETWAGLCRPHHRWTHENPSKAEAIGLLHPDRFK